MLANTNPAEIICCLTEKFVTLVIMCFQYIFRKYVQNGLTLIAFVCDHMINVCVQMKYIQMYVNLHLMC